MDIMVGLLVNQNSPLLLLIDYSKALSSSSIVVFVFVVGIKNAAERSELSRNQREAFHEWAFYPTFGSSAPPPNTTKRKSERRGDCEKQVQHTRPTISCLL